RGRDNASESSASSIVSMKPRTRERTPSSIASNQSSKSKASAAPAASFVVSLIMAWSPFQRANAGIIGVEQPGDYANPIPTTSATGPSAVPSATDVLRAAQILATQNWLGGADRS